MKPKIDKMPVNKWIKLKPKAPRKFIFGKIPVCSKCGCWVNRKEICCKNSKTISLKEYIETIRKEKFKEEDWKFEDKPDIVVMHGIDADAEIAQAMDRDYLEKIMICLNK